MKKVRLELSGKQFHRLSVQGFSHTDRFKSAIWLCKCECGKETLVNGKDLVNGHTKSCGCWKKEVASKRLTGKRGDQNQSWKGGRKIDTRGYVLIFLKDHPRANKQGYVFEHILVMEKMLGRPLAAGFVVHHCNLNRQDNRPYNLRLFNSNSEHARYHHKLNRELRAA